MGWARDRSLRDARDNLAKCRHQSLHIDLPSPADKEAADPLVHLPLEARAEKLEEDLFVKVEQELSLIHI